jgi:hypothetical protein
MIDQLDSYYLQYDEPVQGCLLALRTIILKQDINITAEWKYNMPFYCYKGKMFCYLWVNKTTGEPYMGFVEGKHLTHQHLIAGERTRIKILPINANEDMPIELITDIIHHAIGLYKSGLIKIKAKK